MRVHVSSWHCGSIMIQVGESAVYLRSTLHAVGTHHHWDGKLRINGLKASFALQELHTKQGFYVPELQLVCLTRWSNLS